MENRKCIYFVEGECEEKLINALKVDTSLVINGKVKFQNLMKLQVSDAKAHIMIPIVKQRIEICEQMSGELAKQMYDEIS